MVSHLNDGHILIYVISRGIFRTFHLIYIIIYLIIRNEKFNLVNKNNIIYAVEIICIIIC